MERCALELGTLWGAATIDENFASINPSSPITCLSRWSKNPFGEAKWAFYVPPGRLKEVDTRACAQKRKPPKWEVSVPLRGLMLMVDSDALGLLFLSRSSQNRSSASFALAPAWKHNQFAFISLFLSDICYITGWFHKPPPGSVHPAGPGSPTLPSGAQSRSSSWFFYPLISILFPSPR